MGNVEEINIGCENDLNMWIEVTERQKIIQYKSYKAVLSVPILIG